MAFGIRNYMSYWDRNIAHMVKRLLSAGSFVIRSLNGLIFMFTWMVGPTRQCCIFYTANTKAKHYFSTGL